MKCCTQLKVLTELNSEFIRARMERVNKPEETTLLFGLQELIRCVKASNLCFYEWCVHHPADKELVLQCQQVISEESEFAESHY